MANSTFTNKCVHCFAELSRSRCAICGGKQNVVNPPSALAVGSILNDRFFISTTLGQGGFGITYKAFDLRDNKMVAIKEFFPPYATRTVSGDVKVEFSEQLSLAKGIKKFVEEAKHLATLKDLDGTIKVFDFFNYFGTAYIVMEYVSGLNFNQYLKKAKKKLELDFCLKLLSPVFSSLIDLHSNDIVHRDISPDNIIVSPSGAKLIDYGAASTTKKHLDIIVKRHFAPPEQYSRTFQDHHADIYALSASIYFAITAKLPQEANKRQIKDSLIPPIKLAKVTQAQSNALLKAMSLDQNERYNSINDFISALS